MITKVPGRPEPLFAPPTAAETAAAAAAAAAAEPLAAPQQLVGLTGGDGYGQQKMGGYPKGDGRGVNGLTAGIICGGWPNGYVP